MPTPGNENQRPISQMNVGVKISAKHDEVESHNGYNELQPSGTCPNCARLVQPSKNSLMLSLTSTAERRKITQSFQQIWQNPKPIHENLLQELGIERLSLTLIKTIDENLEVNKILSGEKREAFCWERKRQGVLFTASQHLPGSLCWWHKTKKVITIGKEEIKLSFCKAAWVFI